MGKKIVAVMRVIGLILLSSSVIFGAQTTYTPALSNYCVQPPFLSGYVPPQVLFTLGKDHKFFYPAYNDVSDIDGDGKLDAGYRHAIVYKGYFDPNKCYDYTVSTGKNVFVPTSITATRYCDGTKWSGNFLNWLTMSRADIVKKVLYGGLRTRDTSAGIGETYLSGEGIPQDGHAWGKEYVGSDITSLVPTSQSVVDGHRALFCVVHNGADNDDFKLSSNATPIAQLRMLPDMGAAVFAPYAALNSNTGLRIWNWVNVEMGAATSKNICADFGIDTNGDGTVNNVANFPVKKYEVTVKVCDVNVGVEDNCKTYGSNTKPRGLMQMYGESSSTQKICSKDMSTPCSSNTNCVSNGECVDNTNMYFGLMAGSYKNPKAGGYLRKNLWGIANETVASTGLLQTSDPDQKGLIMKSVEALKCPAGTGYYPLSSHWGNPIGEIMFESMRYLAGKVTPTSDYITGITSTSDAGLYASKPDWDNPSQLFPSCSIPFVLLFSDVYNSFDGDQIPGSNFSSFSSSGNLTDFDAKTLGNAISTNESKTDAIVGVSGTTAGANTDGMCTAKTINGFGEIKGICPAEADLEGTYYPAAVALYGSTKMKTKENKANVLTYVVAFNSNIPEFVLNANGKSVTVIPMAKALADGSGVAEWSCTTGNFNFGIDATRGLTITPKNAVGKCPTMAIVTVYVLDHKYDANDKLTFVKFKVASDTLNGSSDYDMDGVAEYTLCAGPAANGCNDNAVGADQVRVTVTAQSSSAGTNFAHGYVIAGTGTTTDGVYLPVRKYYTNGDTTCGSGTLMWGAANLCLLPLTKTKTFNASTNNPGLLKNPLWYTAKYGGFKDYDGDGLPYTDSTCSLPINDAGRNAKCNEWSSKVPGVPDNYFEVSNPSQLEQRLRDALDAILARVASGTAASILNNSEGSGASLLQAVFYPKKDFDNNTSAYWIGELHNMWYYIDPFLNNTSIREDTNLSDSSDAYKLTLTKDRIAKFDFDAAQNKTVVNLFNDANGDGIPDTTAPVATVDSDDVKSLWKAGRKLWARTLSADTRLIYTHTDITTSGFDDATSRLTPLGYLKPVSPSKVGTSNVATLTGTSTSTASTTQFLSLMNLNGTDATKVINYIHGTDQAGYLGRKVQINACNVSGSGCQTSDSNYLREWKLGDIVSSTPKLVSSVALNNYHKDSPFGYADTSYKAFIGTSTYTSRGMAFVGANDGMLHAFRLGTLQESTSTRSSTKAQFNDSSTGTLATSSSDLGREEWAFVPKQVLPYLQYVADAGHSSCHIFTVDKSPSIADVSIAKPSDCSATNYWDCPKDTTAGTNWRTILVGGMGFGGAAKWNGNGSFTAPGDSVKTPVKVPTTSPVTTANAATGVGYSSYFALDVTDPTTPKYLWEFPGSTSAVEQLGYSTTGPAIVHISSHTDSANSSGLRQRAVDNSKNGRWFAVFASGPTGPIDTVTSTFKGQSDQKLSIFVVDLADGSLVRTITAFDDGSTWPLNAFAGTLTTSWIDTDRATPSSIGWYSDDAIYIGYTYKHTDGTWTKGGVVRIATEENTDPSNWKVSKLIDGVGPITTSVSKLQDRKNHNLWIYFGTGRYFYKGDDTTNTQTLYGIKDPCYTSGIVNATATHMAVRQDSINPYCTTTVSGTLVDQSGSASTAPSQTISTSAPGWKVNLSSAASGFSPERVITDPLASTAGAVFFTTFTPSNDVCTFGGNTYIWALDYKSGAAPPTRAMMGKALLQVSTGAFKELSLADAFKNPTNKGFDGRRISTAITGVPPTSQGLSIVTNPPPVKKFLHVREK
jgi:type IV pilus assembly protein PilY1